MPNEIEHDSPRTKRPWRQPILLALLLGSALALQVDALRKPFFADDYFFLEQARGRSLPATLASPDPLGNFLRPVSRQAYFWFLGRVSHESPAVFHWVNLLLFLGGLVLVFLLARRLAGEATAFTAAVFLGFHYAADVPLRWASGSQDLLAIVLALATIYLHSVGKRWVAAVTLLLALLSKESVALTALVAIVAAHQSGQSWQRALRNGAALIAVTMVWAIWWLLTLRQRPAAGQTLSFEPSTALATIAHLAQVALGLEFRMGGSALDHWGVVGFLAGGVGAAILWLVSQGESAPTTTQEWTFKLDVSSPLVRVGLACTVAGTLPLIVVMPIWSAYYYLFALVGVALLVAALTAEMPTNTRAAVVGILVLLSGQARRLDEFAPVRGAWTWQSHVNRHYLDRALAANDRYLKQLRAARPSLPPRSTVFCADVPVSLGWQSGNGPLLRWAYRDSSLRSYFLNQFTRERAERGPVFFFAVEGDSLREKTTDPMLLPSFAYSMLLADHPRAAIDALDLALASD